MSFSRELIVFCDVNLGVGFVDDLLGRIDLLLVAVDHFYLLSNNLFLSRDNAVFGRDVIGLEVDFFSLLRFFSLRLGQ